MNQRDINVHLAAILLMLAPFCTALGGRSEAKNMPPECNSETQECGCPRDGEVLVDCIKVQLNLGRTTPWSGSVPCALKVFADDMSPSVFTPESLYAVTGYTFKRIGNKVLPDGKTPAEVVFSHPNGEPVHFIFKEGESVGCPDPGIHVKMDERLQMTDAKGWATTSDPVYYDFYEDDGTVRRFLATDMTGERGKMIHVRNSRGRILTAEDMGIDIVYGADGVRQFLTPSRLADVDVRTDGYDVKVYPLQSVPQKDAATGLYVPPSVQAVKRLSVRRSDGDRRAIVSIRSGDAEPRTFVFDYVRGDWSLTRPSGVQERKDRTIADAKSARVVKEVLSPSGEMLSRKERNYKWESWGFAMTNRIEGFGGVTDTTEWTYVKSGNGKGRIASERRQSGLTTAYAYDALDRKVSETKSGPGMKEERVIYSYDSVDPSDVVPPVDSRPRTVVKTLDGIECERTYFVYSALTNIVERVGTQGAAYGGTNVLRMVIEYWPIVPGDVRSGLVRSVRHEDGTLDVYDYVLSSNIWTETVTHLHELSPSPVGGKTTRDITITNGRGETVEKRTEAYVEGAWRTIARDRLSYNPEGKLVRKENLAGQVSTAEWDCCHKTSETQPDGTVTTYDYDDDGRLVASSRLIPLDMTNVAWLTTCYAYDGLGREIATWKTNYAQQVGLPATRTIYDALGRIVARIDALGNTTTTSYSPDGLILSVLKPNTSTIITTRNASGELISITGTAVLPEFHSRGIDSDGTRWTRIVRGEDAASPRFTKAFRNMLGQVVLEERSGFRGAVLSTAYGYDAYSRQTIVRAEGEPTVMYEYDLEGERIATTRMVGRAAPSAPQSDEQEWRKTESRTSYARIDGSTWLVKTNVVTCSDSSIAPLVTADAEQLTGLTATMPSHSTMTDMRGNVEERWAQMEGSIRKSFQRIPSASNVVETNVRYGMGVMEASASCVTNLYAYDALGRQMAKTDGRGNVTRTEYDAAGRKSADIDALGNRTAYAYDRYGNLAAVTNPLGNATIYEYDLRGRKTYEGGATYPVRYTYDVFGKVNSISTFSNELLDQKDLTMFIYDDTSDFLKYKVDGSGNVWKYGYMANGSISNCISPKGIESIYSYNEWGVATNISLSDNSYEVSFVFDALGREIEIHNQSGVITYTYDQFGSITNETSLHGFGFAAIARHFDRFGRIESVFVDGKRQAHYEYDENTGRIASVMPYEVGIPFRWTYIPGSDLKASLSYPNGFMTLWSYDEAGRIKQVSNVAPNRFISLNEYTYDSVGHVVCCNKSYGCGDISNSIHYAYNIRGELTNAVSNINTNYCYAYSYDDAGNRKYAKEEDTLSLYSTGACNQYNYIVHSKYGTLLPQFDANGNQTSIHHKGNVWEVAYNGKNQAVKWINGSTNVLMSYDGIGRQIFQKEYCGATNLIKCFSYDGFCCIKSTLQDMKSNIMCDKLYLWDVTDLSNPYVLMQYNAQGDSIYYVYDGLKNVSAIVDANSIIIEQYEYAPFGEIVSPASHLVNTNPFRFSSKYYDDLLKVIHYGFREYSFFIGRWSSRDPLQEFGGNNLYLFVGNNPIAMYDILGLMASPFNKKHACEESGGNFYLGKCCCGSENYSPDSNCCLDAGEIGKVILDRNAQTVATRHSWHFSPNDMIYSIYKMEDHVWLTWGNTSVDSNGLGDEVVHTPAVLIPSSANSSGQSNGDKDIKLSNCEYNIFEFGACLGAETQKDNNKKKGKCNEYVDSLIEKCKQKAKRDPAL